jgi:hypothetical protein
MTRIHGLHRDDIPEWFVNRTAYNKQYHKGHRADITAKALKRNRRLMAIDPKYLAEAREMLEGDA